MQDKRRAFSAKKARTTSSTSGVFDPKDFRVNKREEMEEKKRAAAAEVRRKREVNEQTIRFNRINILN